MGRFDGFDITGDFEELQEMVKGLAVGEDALKRATVRAVNRTATSVRGKAVELIRQDYNVKAKDVRATLKIYKANFSRLRATIYGAQNPGVPLYKFSVAKKAPSTKRTKTGRYTPKGGIKVHVTRGQRKQVRGGFVQRMKSGHVGVFRRMGKGRGNWWEPSDGNRIEELSGPSPIRLLDSDHIQIPLDNHAAERLDIEMAEQADHYLKKAGLI